MKKRRLPTNDIYWASVDPANKSGIAFWIGDKLESTGVLRMMGKSGQYRMIRKICLDRGLVKTTYPNKCNAWDCMCSNKGGIVIEEGAGRFTTAVKSQAKLRGYIEHSCDSFSVQYQEVNVSEWRRVVREAYGVSFPANSKGCKELSKKLVKQEFGIDVSDDEADAVLLGKAALRLRVLDWM